jgi:hypothetical protein
VFDGISASKAASKAVTSQALLYVLLPHPVRFSTKNGFIESYYELRVIFLVVISDQASPIERLMAINKEKPLVVYAKTVDCISGS